MVEDVVVRELGALGGDTVEHVGEVFEFAAKHLADGLMAETHAEDGLLALVSLYHVEQQSSLGRDARSGTEHYLVERFQLVERKLVVAYHRHVGTGFFYQVTQVVCKRVVVVYNNYLVHCQSNNMNQ